MRAASCFGLAAAASLLSACGSAPPDPRGVRPGETLLQVSASGRAETAPDEALFAAGVNSTGATAAAASAANNEIMTRVTAALGRVGVAREDLQTRSLNVSRIEYGPNRGRYQATNMIEVRLRDVNRASEAIAAVTDAGANILSGPNLRVADPERANLSAHGEAYRAARARAEAYAEAAGLRIVRVVAIRDGGLPSPEAYHSMNAAYEQAMPRAVSAAPPVEPGTNRTQVSVSVDFALAE